MTVGDDRTAAFTRFNYRSRIMSADQFTNNPAVFRLIFFPPGCRLVFSMKINLQKESVLFLSKWRHCWIRRSKVICSKWTCEISSLVLFKARMFLVQITFKCINNWRWALNEQSGLFVQTCFICFSAEKCGDTEGNVNTDELSAVSLKTSRTHKLFTFSH